MAEIEGCGDCACEPVRGSQRCVPQFGPLIALPLTDIVGPAAGNGAMIEDNQALGLRRFTFDWSGIVPGLTGLVNVLNDRGIGIAARTRFSGVSGLLTGNTTLCTAFNIEFSLPVQLRRLRLLDFDGPNNECAHSFSPRVDGTQGPIFLSAGEAVFPGTVGQRCRPHQGGEQVARGSFSNASGAVIWNAPTTRTVSWSVFHRGLLSTAFPDFEIQAPLADRHAVREVCNDGSERWVYADDGAILTPAEVDQLRECA